jgi:DNA-binding response OmpR family regulator
MSNVLLVEDDPTLRRILTLNLAHHGFSVAEAESVETADEILAAAAAGGNPFHLILLDINLPDGSGWDLLRKHRASAASVIILTAIPPLRQRILEFRPAAVLPKPFPIDALLRNMERVLKAMSGEPDHEQRADMAKLGNAGSEQATTAQPRK